jgi:hypothetical protein
MQTMTVLMNSVQLLDLRQIKMMEYLVSWAFDVRPCKCQDARNTIFLYRSDMFYSTLYNMLYNISDIACYITGLIACYVTCYVTCYMTYAQSMSYNMLCSRLRCMLYETYDPNLYQGQGPLTYAGLKRSSTEHHHRGKQVLDIHLLKAERLAALPLELPASVSGPPGMLDADNAATPEWVTYAFRTAHPILQSWLCG